MQPWPDSSVAQTKNFRCGLEWTIAITSWAPGDVSARHRTRKGGDPTIRLTEMSGGDWHERLPTEGPILAGPQIHHVTSSKFLSSLLL